MPTVYEEYKTRSATRTGMGHLRLSFDNGLEVLPDSIKANEEDSLVFAQDLHQQAAQLGQCVKDREALKATINSVYTYVLTHGSRFANEFARYIETGSFDLQRPPRPTTITEALTA